MLAVAAFKDWNPSHYLDVAEMTHALAVGYDWLYAELSPESRATIRTAICEKGLKPSLDIYAKKRWWAAAIHNWNQVCNGGMAVGALGVADEEPELAGRIVSLAATSIRLPTARLEPDGGWDEGPGYWNYAMTYTAYYLAAMQTALGTDFGLSTMPGMAETGLFRIHSIGPSGRLFNYADAGEGPGSAIAMFLFARLYHRPAYAYHQRKFLRTPSALDVLWYDPAGTTDDFNAIPLDALFTNVDVAFLRSSWDDRALYVGFKGGNNAANHSHLDLGTFVLDADGRHWVLETGPDEYNLPGYFGKQRWTYYRLRTEGQNTLLLNGDNQAPKAKAPIIAFESTPRRAHAVADLSAAYARHARRVQRGMALLERKCVLIQDEIESEAPVDVRWIIHTRAEASIQGDRVILTMQRERLNLLAVDTPGSKWVFGPVQIDPPQRPADGINRLELQLKTTPGTSRIAVAVWPGGGQAPPVSLEPGPLASWGGRRSR